MFRSANPALREEYFQPAEGAAALRQPESAVAEKPKVMTVAGTVNKTYILLALCVASAIFSWSLVVPAGSLGQSGEIDPNFSPGALIGIGAIGGLIFALITAFKPKAAPYTAPIYALLEGLFVGAISALYAVEFGQSTVGGFEMNIGMVFNAIILTFGMLGAMLLAWRTGIIKVTERFKMIITAAIGGIMLVYLIGFVMSFFGTGIPLIHGSGPVGIGFSVVVIGIAGLSLALDFEFIAQGVQAGAPKHMEWYAGFGLLVTLIWLYIEILHLLAKLQGRE